MFRRLLLILALATLPAILTACPDNDSTLGDEIEEGVEEIEDEIDDAL
jgi:hypothetical protein